MYCIVEDQQPLSCIIPSAARLNFIIYNARDPGNRVVTMALGVLPFDDIGGAG
jgi:hypothetical protein